LRRWLGAIVAMLMPGLLARPLLRLMGHRIGTGVRIGWSWIMADRLWLQTGSRIGHFNVVVLHRLVMRRGAYIGRQNHVRGPLSIQLDERAAIGNRNRITRAPTGLVTSGPSTLRLGELSKITAGHLVDCSAGVRIGAFSTIAGLGSQLWTHGYVHATNGADRYRIDGGIEIADNVYVGTGVIIVAGAVIGSGVLVGAGAVVSGRLDEPGLYVMNGLRRLPRPTADPSTRDDLVRVDDPRLCEPVFRKRGR
jgi:acetyltransferase-like isoleucine patch superfamily enzyme